MKVLASALFVSLFHPYAVPTSRPIIPLPPCGPCQTMDTDEQDLYEMGQQVYTREDIADLLYDRGLIYPTPTSPEYIESYDYHYSSTLSTFRRGYGVCDDLAVTIAYFLQKLPDTKEIAIGEIRPIPSQDLTDVERQVVVTGYSLAHAGLLYETSSESWGYTNNLEISEPSYSSKDDALKQFLCKSYTATTAVKVSFWNIPALDRWAFEDNLSTLLMPFFSSGGFYGSYLIEWDKGDCSVRTRFNNEPYSLRE